VTPLVSPLIDGELAAADRAGVEAHLAHCAACRAALEAERAFSWRLRAEATRHAAPAGLRARVTTAIAAETVARHGPQRREWMRLAAAALIGAVLASGGTWELAIGERQAGAADEVVASHIRSLMPGHLTDVVSGDGHTVKPWFNGRVDFSPPVVDLAEAGFPLVGGRLDYLDGHPAASLVYKRRQHVINLFVTAEPGPEKAAPSSFQRQGFNVVSWRDGGMRFRAVSDVNAGELQQFEELVRGVVAH